ncbi:Cytochrome P450 [Corchorus capsularis]|uniref:Cytochrome P450 n=1 Tax=Corchorus capsularis TaxID=210143 RepID=A0A1R3HPA1_COCAP|nr:Cytochrome P450 [Corchorus capsularis]
MLEDYQELLGGFSTGDFFPSMEFIHSFTSMKSRLQHTFQRFDRFFDQVIDEHLNPDRQKEKRSKDLLDYLLDVQRNGTNEITLTMDNVKAIMLVSKIKTLLLIELHVMSTVADFIDVLM